MTTRRHFIRGAASGIVFCSCGMKAFAQSLSSARTGGGDAGDNPSLNYKHPDFGKWQKQADELKLTGDERDLYFFMKAARSAPSLPNGPTPL